MPVMIRAASGRKYAVNSRQKTMLMVLVLMFALTACQGDTQNEGVSTPVQPGNSHAPIPSIESSASDDTNSPQQRDEDAPTYALIAARQGENGMLFRFTPSDISDTYEVKDHGDNVGWSIQFGSFELTITPPTANVNQANTVTSAELVARLWLMNDAYSKTTLSEFAVTFDDGVLIADITIPDDYVSVLNASNNSDFEVRSIIPTEYGHELGHAAVFPYADTVKTPVDVLYGGEVKEGDLLELALIDESAFSFTADKASETVTINLHFDHLVEAYSLGERGLEADISLYVGDDTKILECKQASIRCVPL